MTARPAEGKKKERNGKKGGGMVVHGVGGVGGEKLNSAGDACAGGRVKKGGRVK